MQISSDAERALKAEVREDEQVLWQGQPNPISSLQKSFLIYVFAIPWTAFSIFWIYAASGFGQRPIGGSPFSYFPLFGLPFVLIGLTMLASPYWAYKKAFNTVYAVTDKRALTITGSSSRSVESYYPNSFGEIDRRERSDGTGTIIFLQYTTGYGDSRTSVAKGFFGIENVREVENLIRTNLMSSTSQPPPPPTTRMNFNR